MNELQSYALGHPLLRADQAYEGRYFRELRGENIRVGLTANY